jgi:hypothetical protein
MGILPRDFPLSLVLALREVDFMPISFAAFDDALTSVSVCGGDIMAAS